ncbi:MAG: [LysW]-aminoadipate/[LysW]-glutamate kinase [Candidatus Bathyarchaeia archaeon]
MLTVVKIGGSILRKGFPANLSSELRDVMCEGRVILVHGGAAIVTEMAEKLGKKQQFIQSPDGMRSRYTDLETMEVYTMVMAGKLNKQIVAALASRGIKSIGISGVDGNLLKAERKKRLLIQDERGRKVIIDGGYTGKITKVESDVLKALLSFGFLPVIAPIAVGDEFEFLNVDSDRAAAYIAGALDADKLIFLTDVEGVILDGVKVDRMTVEDAKMNLQRIGHGMKKKVYAAMEALSMGVNEVVITSGLLEKPISSSFRHEVGTVIAVK